MNKTSLLDLFFGILLVAAGAGLILGLYTGLIRLGISLPETFDLGPLAHGPLMINGFLATLISLERGAALEKMWSYIAPFSFVLSTAFFLGKLFFFAGFFLLLGSFFLIIIMGYLCYLQRAVHHFIMAAGAAALLTGNILYTLNFPVFELVGWWLAFPLLTIFGERLELNRIMRPPKKARTAFAILISLWMATLPVVHFSRYAAWLINSSLLIAIAAWLIRYDVARKTIQSREWTRYSAWCLLTGYGWLIAAGLLGILFGLPYAGFSYDALLHIFFVGFIFSMIFAHASVIIPSLTGKLVPWSNYFYLPFFLLHGFLILRLTGDLLYLQNIRVLGSYGNVLAILLFLGGILSRILFKVEKLSSEN